MSCTEWRASEARHGNNGGRSHLAQAGVYYFGALCGALAAGALHDALPRGAAQGASVSGALACSAAATLAFGAAPRWLWGFTLASMAAWYGAVLTLGAARGAALAAVPCLVADAYGEVCAREEDVRVCRAIGSARRPPSHHHREEGRKGGE